MLELLQVGANYKLLNAKKETKKTNVSKLFYVLTVDIRVSTCTVIYKNLTIHKIIFQRSSLHKSISNFMKETVSRDFFYI